MQATIRHHDALEQRYQRARLRRTPTSRLLTALILASAGLGACQSAPPSAPAPISLSTPAGSVAKQAPAQPAAGRSAGVVSVGVDQEPLSLDPQASTFASSYYITSSMGESLVYLDEHRDIQPWLADSWQIEDGGAAFTFKLRKDVTFQDGTPFNASAVKWNFDRIVDPSFKAGSALNYLGPYQATDIIDDFTVRVRFTQPFVPFLTYAGSPALDIVSPTATAKQGDQANRAPVMSGPYKVDEWVAKDHITISRWVGYTRHLPWSDHDGSGYADRVVFKFIPDAGTRSAAVESGETQLATVLMPRDVDRLRGAGLQIASTPWGGSGGSLHLNVTKPPTDDLQVRRAVAAALDPEPLIQNIYTGVRAVGPLVANVLDDPSLHTRTSGPDPGAAGELLDAAGWQPGPDGVRTRRGQRLTFVLNGLSDSALALGGGPYPYIQGQLRQIGMDVSIKLQTQAAYLDDNFRCANNGVISFTRMNELDVMFTLYHSSRVGANSNYACLRDASIDQMLEQGRQEVDPIKRKQVYVELERKILDQAYLVPLVDTLNVFALRPDVHGLKFNGVSYPVITDIFIQS